MSGFLEYVSGTSVLHGLNPVVKLSASFLIVIACFLTSNFVLLGAVLALDVVLALACGMLRDALRLARNVAIFSLLLCVLALLFTPQGSVLVELPWGYIGTTSVENAVLVVLRLVACAVPLFLTFYVTKLTDMANALVKVLHLPYKYAFMFTSIVHFIPVFMNDMRGIMEAQTARGVEFDGSFARRLKLMMPLCVPLLVGSVRKTNSAAIAAEVRGFNVRTRESGYKEYPMRAPDGIACAVSVLLVVLAVIF